MNRVLALGAAVLLMGSAAWAGEAAKGDIAVQGAFARATPGAAKNGGAFMTITNKGKDADRLVAASSGVAKIAELHTHIKDGDVMKMRPVGQIDVPAGQTVTLQPGGLHVMLMELGQPLKEGGTFPLTLKFEKAGEVEVTVDVQGVGAMAPMGAMDHSKMPMHR